MPSRLTLRLTAQQRQALEQLRDSKHPQAWQRAAALLLLDAGASLEQVHQGLGICRQTLLNWRQRWLQEGLDGLEDRPRQGRPPRVSRAYVRCLVRALQKNPRRLGFAFCRWTAPRLESYLARETGVRVSERWMRRLIQRYGFVWRKTKRTIRNLQDPALVEQAQKRLERLKKRPDEEKAENSGSPTEPTSRCCP